MKRNGSKFHRCIAHLLLYAISLNGLIMLGGSFSTAQAQRRIIIVNADQPNLWTLEQAHYLLAQMHRRNLDLKTKSVGELDPNEIAGLRFEVMRMMIEFGATFNQADLATNRLLSENRTFNAERRQQLLTERDGLRRDSIKLAGEIEDLELEKANTDDENEKKRIDARIAAKNNRLARVDKQLEIVNGELGTLTAPSGDPTATTGSATFSREKLPKSDFDDAFKNAAKKQIEKFNDSPQLNASLRLDNFLQMQYEIISKQLSLLRDELGPGERLVFLELPQTVNAAHHESKNKWAQSWWRIAGYTKRVHAGLPAPEPSRPRLVESYKPITTEKDLNSIFYGDRIVLPVAPCSAGGPKHYRSQDSITIRDGDEASTIVVNDSGRISNVTVEIRGFRHPQPDDVDLLLVGPHGQNVLLISDAGGTHPAQDLTIRLDSSAMNPLPDSTALIDKQSYQPVNHDPHSDPFPGNINMSGGSHLSIFNQTNSRGKWRLYAVDDNGKNEGSIAGWTLTITSTCDDDPQPHTAFVDQFVNLDDPTSGGALNTYLTSAGAPRLENRMVRTVELIPRQSSLNVNDMKLNVRAGAFNFVLSTLFGFGSQLSVQRQREQFSQFVQQELYSAAFGKGSREFGWTFTPMPGMDRLQSGVRTTYAVVVVPEDAASLVLESNGCYFPRSSYQPNNFSDTKSDRWNELDRTSRNCGVGGRDDARTRAFVVPIPKARLEGGNEFWVDKVGFSPVAKGERVVVSITGKNLSPQIGVLINGVPLVQSIGLAQPLIRDDSAAGREAAKEFDNGDIRGRIERVDSEKLVFSFTMGPNYTGTPSITLIAPGRSSTINDLKLTINEKRDTPLDEYSPIMFGQEPDPATFRIDRVRVFRGPGTSLRAVVNGAGFVDNGAGLPKVFINGFEHTAPRVESAKLIRFRFEAPLDDSIKITLVSQDPDPKKRKTVESEAITNPVFLSVSDVEVITYENATEDEPATLVAKITGTGFTDRLLASIGEIAVKSSTEAILTITNPRAAALVTLEDRDTGRRVKIVVTRKSKSSK